MRSKSYAPHLRKLRERLAMQVPPALAAVARYFPLGTQVVSSAGGWWLWLALPQQCDALALLQESVKHGIAFTPGCLFSGEGRFGHHMRINIGRPWSIEMEQCFRTLGRLALQQMNRS